MRYTQMTTSQQKTSMLHLE
uniref:Uncharacterized protein n=1 Tax=Arundo donax TaxID=35708 RepID=A0A0A8YUB4_ARUDO